METLTETRDTTVLDGSVVEINECETLFVSAGLMHITSGPPSGFPPIVRI